MRGLLATHEQLLLIVSSEPLYLNLKGESKQTEDGDSVTGTGAGVFLTVGYGVIPIISVSGESTSTSSTTTLDSSFRPASAASSIIVLVSSPLVIALKF